MTTERKTSIVKKSKSAVVKPTPAEIQEVFQHCESEDFELSCLHLIQGVDSGNFRGMDAGDWVESTTGDKATGRKFTYVLAFKERLVWHHRDNAAGLKGLVARFGANEAVPPDMAANIDYEIVETLNIFVLLDDERVPAVIRLKKTALKAGRSLNSAEHRRMLNGQPCGVYALQADVKQGNGFTWFVPMFEKIGDATGAQLHRIAEAREFLRTTRARVMEADGSTDRPHVPTNGKPLSETHEAAQASTRKKPVDVAEESIPF